MQISLVTLTRIITIEHLEVISNHTFILCLFIHSFALFYYKIIGKFNERILLVHHLLPRFPSKNKDKNEDAFPMTFSTISVYRLSKGFQHYFSIFILYESDLLPGPGGPLLHSATPFRYFSPQLQSTTVQSTKASNSLVGYLSSIVVNMKKRSNG